MNIDWNLIKEKFPEVFKKLLTYLLKDFKFPESNLNEVCHCKLESFFDENDYEIFIFKVYKKGLPKGYSFNIQFNGTAFYSCDVYRDRPEAKMQAVEKAFEILETFLRKDS